MSFTNSNPMTFEPMFPWVDDERDTKAYIPYDAPNKEEIYTPTYVIMKQYYDEEKERLYGKGWNNNNVLDTEYDEYEGWEWYENGYTTPTGFDSEYDTEGDYDGGAVSENETDDAIAQPPLVSNKFWYS